MLGFVHIPKCAGSSIQQWFKTNKVALRRDGHCRLCDYDSIDLGAIDFWFTVVRDPYQRTISQYEFSNYKARRMLAKKPDWKYYQQMLEMYQQGFSYWLENFHTLNQEFEYTQYSYVLRGDRVAVDAVIKLENLTKAWGLINDITGCYAPLPHIKSSLRSRDSYFSHKDQQYVNDLYREDFERFGYVMRW